MDKYEYKVKEVHIRHEGERIFLGFETEEGYKVIMDINQGLAWHMKHKMEQAAGVEPISAEDQHAIRWWGMRP